MAKRTCSIPGCDRNHKGRGLCALHLRRQRTHGDPTGGKYHSGEPPLVRFFRHVDTSSPGNCWLWLTPVASTGYGMFSELVGEGRRRWCGAHRWAYQALVGPIATGLELDHLCRNRACVNPAHLEPVTHRTNQLRGETFAARNVSAVSCPKGHPYDETNTYLSPCGKRVCRACRRAASRRYAARLRSAL